MLIVPLYKDLAPYRFQIDLAGVRYTFELNYNGRFDYFTLDCELDGVPLATGENIVYGRPMYSGLTDVRLPAVNLVPRDVSGRQSVVNYANLGESVFLYVEDR